MEDLRNTAIVFPQILKDIYRYAATVCCIRVDVEGREATETR
jgi:hypothetical protein